MSKAQTRGEKDDAIPQWQQNLVVFLEANGGWCRASECRRRFKQLSCNPGNSVFTHPRIYIDTKQVYQKDKSKGKYTVVVVGLLPEEKQEQRTRRIRVKGDPLLAPGYETMRLGAWRG
jgi:uncharacterized Zn-finger protein